MKKNIIVNLKDTNIQKLKNNNLCVNCLYVLLKILKEKDIIKIVEKNDEYIQYKQKNKKNFTKNKYNLITKKIIVNIETYKKMEKLKEHLNISKSFIINKIIEYYL